MKVLASEIVKKYGTNNPYEISKSAGIIIIKEPLGNIEGYYNNVDGQKFIHLNDSESEYFLHYVLAHLLYKAFTDDNDMMFLKRKTVPVFTESEAEANTFALYLCFPNGELTLQQLCDMFHLSDDEVENLLNRLYKVWDSNRKMSPDELLKYVIQRNS